jgi:hypothetical protein
MGEDRLYAVVTVPFRRVLCTHRCENGQNKSASCGRLLRWAAKKLLSSWHSHPSGPLFLCHGRIRREGSPAVECRQVRASQARNCTRNICQRASDECLTKSPDTLSTEIALQTQCKTKLVAHFVHSGWLSTHLTPKCLARPIDIVNVECGNLFTSHDVLSACLLITQK